MSNKCKCDDCKCGKIKQPKNILAIDEVKNLLDELSNEYNDMGIALRGERIDKRIKKVKELLEFLR